MSRPGFIRELIIDAITLALMCVILVISMNLLASAVDQYREIQHIPSEAR